jgi:hypothetical protein
MIYPLYLELPLIPSRSAMQELYDNNMDLYNVLEILESGYDCSKGKRAKGIIEKCLDSKKKTLNVVIGRSFNFHMDTDVWIISHVGITSKRKVKK